MSAAKRSEAFLKVSRQFNLGALVTESSHQLTANLSQIARQDAVAGLKRLFAVDGDVVRRFGEFVQSGRAGEIKEAIVHSLENGGRIFFTGSGATGRLSILIDSLWRDFWRERNRPGRLYDIENRTFSVMAGGDCALIKSVEGFEDFAAFGRRQLRDLGVRAGDVVFAITEGGETSFVIGTAWEGVAAGAKVYFVYNNPDDILCRHVERSREVIEDARIEKINLTTGPMAVTGSTRMQATSIQLCVLLTVLEMAVQELAGAARGAVGSSPGNDPGAVPGRFLAGLEALHAELQSPELLVPLAKLVELEESVYRGGHRTNYFADQLGLDVLTDTTERSPTYCTPPFRKADDLMAAESWAYLFLPPQETPDAWRHILKREPRGIEWGETDVRKLVGDGKSAPAFETIRKISRLELMRFKIGGDGLKYRPFAKGDCAIAIASGAGEKWPATGEFFRLQHEIARKAGARTGLIYFENPGGTRLVTSQAYPGDQGTDKAMPAADILMSVPVPETDFLLDGLTRVAVKLVMNALSTCTMVRLGRVLGNTMIWVVPSNLKLIDRATRYIVQLSGLNYEAANRRLFEVLEYVEPRMKTDQAYPPVVGLAVLRVRHQCSNEEAERKWAEEVSGRP